MLKRFLHFAAYNNAFVLLVAVFVSATGVTLAANPEVRDSILSTQETVRSVDNSYLLSQDLAAFASELKIETITEDPENFYVAYTYKTLEVLDYVWQPISKSETLRVSKKSLAGRDLGVYVAKQLGEVVESKLAYLKEAQSNERLNGITQKIVTTQYAGLIGQLLDPVQQEFPNYQPLISDYVPSEEEKETLAAYLRNGLPYAREDQPASTASSIDPDGEKTIEEQVHDALNDPTGPSNPPVIVLRGNNPERVAVGTSFNDPGADVFDDLDGQSSATVADSDLNTNVVGRYTVFYTATDRSGNAAVMVKRTVEVYEPTASDVSVPSVPPAEEPTPDPSPAPETPPAEPTPAPAPTETSPSSPAPAETSSSTPTAQ